MPFTPFHFGAGLALKGLVPRRFSFSMFALANVAMDIEPLYRMWRAETPIHGFSHTITGAALIAAATLLLGRSAITRWWQLYARLTADSGTPYRMRWLPPTSGAFLGAASQGSVEKRVSMHKMIAGRKNRGFILFAIDGSIA